MSSLHKAESNAHGARTVSMGPPERSNATKPDGPGVDSTNDDTLGPRQKPRSVFEMIRAHAEPSVAAWYAQHQYNTQGVILSDVPLRKSDYVRKVNVMAQRLESFSLQADAQGATLGCSALILQDIDETWADMLCAQFPESVERRFIARHVLRCGDIGEQCAKGSDEAHIRLVKAVDAEIDKTLSQDRRTKVLSLHIDLHGSSGLKNRATLIDPGFGQLGYRNPQMAGSFYTTGTRVSCCQVTQSLYLVLVDKVSLLSNLRSQYEDPRYFRSLRLIGDEGVGLNLPICHRPDDWTPDGGIGLLAEFKALFENFSVRSVFGQQHLLESPHNADVVNLLLVISAWARILDMLEEDWTEVRYTITNTQHEESFARLARCRRQVAEGYQGFTYTRSTLNSVLTKLLQRTRPTGHIVSAAASRDRSPDKVSPDIAYELHLGHGQKGDIKKLPGTLAEYDSRFRLLYSALNDEIRLVIGAVQIEDAKKTREQTELTVRLTEMTVHQARWTMVLTFLAAFYLPMTLATGIFGMNIREISEDKGPSKWWVIGTWAVSFFVTASCVGGYALVSWWQEYRRRKTKEGTEVTISSFFKGQWRAAVGFANREVVLRQWEACCRWWYSVAMVKAVSGWWTKVKTKEAMSAAYVPA